MYLSSINEAGKNIWTINISLDKSLMIIGSTAGSLDQYIKIYTRGEDGVFSLFQEIQEKSLGEQRIVISGDKKTFACAYGYGAVKIFRLQEDGKYLEIQKFQENMTNIRDIAISEDGEFIAYGGPDIPIKVLNLGEDKRYFLKQELKNECNNAWFDCIYMSPDKKMIVAGFNNGLIEIWILGCRGYYLFNFFKGHDKSISDVYASLHKKTIVSSDIDGKVFIWQQDSLLDDLDLPQTLNFLQNNCF